MPKRIKDKNRSIFVKFVDDATAREINSLLDPLGAKAIRVSSLINRWVIEVPFWKAETCLDKMEESGLVDVVHDDFSRRRESQYEQEGQEEIE